MYTFYLGTLKLNFSKELPPLSQHFDNEFQKSVLPTSCDANIFICEVNRLEIPSTPGKQMGNIIMWNRANTEIRLYKLNGAEPYMMSTLHESTVVIYVLTKQWLENKKRFRPWFYIHLEKLLLHNNAFVLHSASIIVNGKAILFTAPSGTGKTTQTDLWHCYRPNVYDLNGDRTLLQWTKDGWFACGFPIYGSVLRCQQNAVPIAGIAVVKRGSVDRIHELSEYEKLSLLYSETTISSFDPEAPNRSVDLIENLIQHTTIVLLECTMNSSAVDVLENRLFYEGET